MRRVAGRGCWIGAQDLVTVVLLVFTATVTPYEVQTRTLRELWVDFVARERERTH